MLALIALVMAVSARPGRNRAAWCAGRSTAAGGWWPRSAGWGIWISYATNPPSESAATLQYMSKYVPQVYNGSSLTTLGVPVGSASWPCSCS